MQIMLGEALAASLVPCEAVMKSAGFLTGDGQAALSSRTSVVAKVLKCCFPAFLSSCWYGFRKA